MEPKLEISEDYLMNVLKSASTKMVGEVLSNVETISTPDELKKAIKNTIYQNFRDFEAQIKAFDCGVRFVKFPRPLVR